MVRVKRAKCTACVTHTDGACLARPACEQASEDSGLSVSVLSREFIIRAKVYELRKHDRKKLRQVYIASAANERSPPECFDVLMHTRVSMFE